MNGRNYPSTGTGFLPSTVLKHVEMDAFFVMGKEHVFFLLGARGCFGDDSVVFAPKLILLLRVCWENSQKYTRTSTMSLFNMCVIFGACSGLNGLSS